MNLREPPSFLMVLFAGRGQTHFSQLCAQPSHEFFDYMFCSLTTNRIDYSAHDQKNSFEELYLTLREIRRTM